MALINGSQYPHYDEPISVRREAVTCLVTNAYSEPDEDGSGHTDRVAVMACTGYLNSTPQVVVARFDTREEAVTYVETDPDGILA